MNLFFDEDTGTGIPKAVQLLRLPAVRRVTFPGSGGPLRKGSSDLEWIDFVAREGYLAFSQNRLILESDVERQTVIDASARIVFIGTGQERSWLVMRLLLVSWDRIVEIHDRVAPPYAFHLTSRGRLRRLL